MLTKSCVRSPVLVVAAFVLTASPVLAVKPMHTLRGSERLARFGEAVEGVDDLDQDGFADFIVGEPMSDHSRGRAVVYSGRSGKPIYKFRGPEPGARFGYSAAGLGDVTGDGVPDFAVGSPLEGPEGRVHVFSGADGSLYFSLAGSTAESKFGARVSRAGDVDGDSLEDLIVAAPGDGEILVFSTGTGKRLSRFTGFQGIKGETRGEMRRFSGTGDGDIRLVGRSAGDVDDDGFVDLLVGDTWAKYAAGEVFVYSGRDGSVMQRWEGGLNGTSYFGFSVDSLADLDGDGWREILIGVSGTFLGPHYSGELEVRSGRTGTLLRRHAAPPGGHNYLGHAVRGVGDLDGDGSDEYLVGLPYRGPNINFLRGAVWLYSGRTGELLVELKGPKRKKAGSGPQFGYYLNPIGDANGDGATDFAISAPSERRGRGAVRLYSGRKLLKGK